MNPGQKRSYPFSDDENLADQQVNLTDYMKMHDQMRILMLENTYLMHFFWKFQRIKRNFRPQKRSKERLNLKKRKLNPLKIQMLNRTGKSG